MTTWHRLAGWVVVTFGLGLSTLGCASSAPTGQTPCPDGDDTCASPSGPALAVGQRSGDDLIPLSQGQKLGLVFGNQGGQHVYIDAVVRLPKGGRWVVDFDLNDMTGQRVGGNSVLLSGCDCEKTFDRLTVFVDNPSEQRAVLNAFLAPANEFGEALETSPERVDVVPVEVSIVN